jgi:NADPH-dependent 2,4-dienoyl-CoA reductase/sulfur reductase-like enzyme/rhodanese-related sulfurtransferase
MKYLIVGAVAGGASTAARLRRLDEHAQIILFEKGEFISYANCGLPYYIGNVIQDRNKLFVQKAASFRQRFNIDVRIKQEVISIDRQNKKVLVKNLLTGDDYVEYYDKLVLSPGAAPIRPPLPGIDLPGIFTLRNVYDTDRIKEYLTVKGIKKAVVVGAGFIGLEMAENLHHQGVQVSVIEMGNQILAPVDYETAVIAQQYLRSKNVDLKLGTAVQSFEQKGDSLLVHLNNGEVLETELVILSIGVRPDSKLAADAGLALGNSKGILVNEFLQTSDKDIYAVGDAIEFTNPITGQVMPTYLAGPANKQGRICADNIVGGNIRNWQGSINTAIVKLFDMTIATAGMAGKFMTRANIPFTTSTTHSGSHAGYYPGAQNMTIRLVFHPENGQLFGAQIAGFDGVDKRIEMLSEVIRREGTIFDLTEWEHAYAPPFSSAKDPVNIAGFTAENILYHKMMPFYKMEEVSENSCLIDVRTEAEFENGHIPGAINIPVDELRDRMNELPKETLYLYCQVGQRGYLAQRILQQHNFDTYNLSGGYALWSQINAEEELMQPILAL